MFLSSLRTRSGGVWDKSWQAEVNTGQVRNKVLQALANSAALRSSQLGAEGRDMARHQARLRQHNTEEPRWAARAQGRTHGPQASVRNGAYTRTSWRTALIGRGESGRAGAWAQASWLHSGCRASKTGVDASSRHLREKQNACRTQAPPQGVLCVSRCVALIHREGGSERGERSAVQAWAWKAHLWRAPGKRTPLRAPPTRAGHKREPSPAQVARKGLRARCLQRRTQSRRTDSGGQVRATTAWPEGQRGVRAMRVGRRRVPPM